MAYASLRKRGRADGAGVIAECMGLGLGKSVDASTLSDAATRLRHLERAIQAKCGLTRAMVFWALTNQISTLDRGKLVRIGKQAYGIA